MSYNENGIDLSDTEYSYGILNRDNSLKPSAIAYETAAEDGTVVYVNAYDSWGSGWGYYVIVDHGLDDYGCHITTLYAHCSAIYVSEGQAVTGGQTCLGAIGNTGWSYGSHLHFEVREDGERVDPLGCGYVSQP